MSRTKHGHKRLGYEYWSRRPGIKMASPSSFAKRLTHRLERRHARRAINQEIKEIQS